MVHKNELKNSVKSETSSSVATSDSLKLLSSMWRHHHARKMRATSSNTATPVRLRTCKGQLWLSHRIGQLSAISLTEEFGFLLYLLFILFVYMFY